MFPHRPSCIHPEKFHLMCWLVSQESIVHYWIFISQDQQTVSTHFWNIILSAYSCHSIRNDGSYLVSEYVFLWKNVRISRDINYYWWHIRVKSIFLVIPLLKRLCGYPILLNCAEKKGSIFGVAFGGVLSCLLNELTWIWILPPGSAFFPWKVSCWHHYPIKLYFE